MTQTRYEVRDLQPRVPASDPRGRVWSRDQDVPGAFHTLTRSTLTLAYDERPNDPRASHQFQLEVDPYGTPVHTAAVAYSRRGAAHAPEQLQHVLVTARTWITNDDVQVDRLRLGVP